MGLGVERRNARTKEHSLGHLGWQPVTARPGELQCCSAPAMQQREENQEKASVRKC